MKLFFEEYAYNIEDLQNVVSPYFYSPDKRGEKAKLNFVGYFFNNAPNNPTEADAVFILPKVFLNSNDEPFELAGVNPSDIINLDDRTNALLHEQGISTMVSELSVWLYQAIQFYLERKSDSHNWESASIRDVVSNKGDEQVTYLDTILQLRKFYKEHRQLLTYVSIINNSGNNKIHWGKTISHELPIVRNNQPTYVSFRTKQKIVNFDEELIVLFYSVLDYLKHQFHFQISVDLRYPLISHQHIAGMIAGCKGTRYLKSIRKKYFTDEFVALWKLLYAYFDKAERIASRRYHEETLLVRSFNPVFEDMIDYLISDEDYPEELKVQDHGAKIVDHLYAEESLIYNNPIYFVGDSKYYGTDRAEMDEHSIAKQYTYAKNIIQRNIDVIYGFDYDTGKIHATDGKYYPYRDDLTKGYNITPNFFISGVAHKEGNRYRADRDELENITGEHIVYNRHFVNRLFDRDTLLLQRYNINFLYVLTAYAAQQTSARNQFRIEARKQFRRHTIDAIHKYFSVYQVCLEQSESLPEFIKRNYYQLAGQIFSFNDGILIYAEEKDAMSVKNTEEARSKVRVEEDKYFLMLEDEEVKLQPIKIGDPIIKEYDVAPAIITLNSQEPEEETPEFEWPIVMNVNDSARYITHLPVYSVRAACGTFNHGDTDEQEGWLDVSSLRIRVQEGMFIVHAEGKSMEPKIKDGSLCVFNRRDMGGSRNGKIVLVESNKYDCRHVIKEYHSTKTQTDEGWYHNSITLHSLNPDFEDINLTEDDEPLIAGFFVTVIDEENYKSYVIS